MGTHGVFVLKDGDEIWGFHSFYDAGNVRGFYDQNKHIRDVSAIFLNACRFFADEGYEDRSYLNFYIEKYKENNDYSNINYHTLYFDGKEWNANFELESEE